MDFVSWQIQECLKSGGFFLLRLIKTMSSTWEINLFLDHHSTCFWQVERRSDFILVVICFPRQLGNRGLFVFLSVVRFFYGFLLSFYRFASVFCGFSTVFGGFGKGSVTGVTGRLRSKGTLRSHWLSFRCL